MSGQVLVIKEENGPYVVACFVDECSEHGDGRNPLEGPWLAEFDTVSHANAGARAHRAEIRADLSPNCPACGQRLPKGGV